MRRPEFVVLGIILGTMLIVGCTSLSGTDGTKKTPIPSITVPTTPVTPDPEASLREYFYAFNFVDDAALSRLLSQRVIGMVGKPAIHNRASEFAARNYISFTDYTVLKKTVEGNSATITVEIGENNQGIRSTSTRTIPFVFEDGTWKLDEFLIPG